MVVGCCVVVDVRRRCFCAFSLSRPFFVLLPFSLVLGGIGKTVAVVGRSGVCAMVAGYDAVDFSRSSLLGSLVSFDIGTWRAWMRLYLNLIVCAELLSVISYLLSEREREGWTGFLCVVYEGVIAVVAVVALVGVSAECGGVFAPCLVFAFL